MDTQEICLRVVAWQERHEFGDQSRPDRPHKRPLPWVAVSTSHESVSYRRIMQHPNGTALWGAFIQILQIAAKQTHPRRGWLIDDQGRPLGADDIAIKASGDEGLISQAIALCTDPKIGLLEWVQANDIPPEVSGNCRKFPVDAGKGGQTPVISRLHEQVQVQVHEQGQNGHGAFTHLNGEWDGVGGEFHIQNDTLNDFALLHRVYFPKAVALGVVTECEHDRLVFSCWIGRARRKAVKNRKAFFATLVRDNMRHVIQNRTDQEKGREILKKAIAAGAVPGCNGH